MKAKWIGHILRSNWLLKCVIEVKIEGRTEVMGRRGKRRKQPLDGLKKTLEFGRPGSQSVENSLWERETDYGIVMMITTSYFK